MNNFNMPPQLMQIMRSGNPQQAAIDLLQRNSNGNPILENAINMVNGNNYKGIENLARNICKSRGIDADELMKNLQGQFK